MVNQLNAGQNFAESILVERTKVTKNQANRLFSKSDILLPKRARDLGIIQDIKEFNIPKGASVITFKFS